MPETWQSWTLEAAWAVKRVFFMTGIVVLIAVFQLLMAMLGYSLLNRKQQVDFRLA